MNSEAMWWYWYEEKLWIVDVLRGWAWLDMLCRQQKIDVIPDLKCPECGSDVSQVYTSRNEYALLYLNKLSCSKCDWEHKFKKLQLERREGVL